MVRTKADAARKAGGKASRKTPVLSGRSTSRVSKSGKKGRSGGGNSYCRRPTPAWQVPITKIFKKSDEGSTAIDEAQEVEDGDIAASASSVNEPGTSGTSSICHDRSGSSERDEIDSDEDVIDEDANGDSDEENNEAEPVEDNNEAEPVEDNNEAEPVEDNNEDESVEDNNEDESVEDNNEAESMDNKEPSTNGKEPLNGHGKHAIECNNIEPSEQIEELNKDNDKLSDRENGNVRSPDSIQINQASSAANSSNL